MEPKQTHSRAMVLGVCLAAVLGMGAAIPARAGSLPAQDEVVEVMLGAQQADALIFLLRFGPDLGSPLHFSSNVSIGGKTFSYSLLPGSTYLGFSMSLSASGAFSSLLASWDWISSGSLGSDSWSYAGTAHDPAIPGEIYDVVLEFWTHGEITYTQTGARTVSEADWVLHHPTYDEYYKGYDTFNRDGPDKGKWTWRMDPVKPSSSSSAVKATGYTPIDGGLGNFTVQVAPVPEPATGLIVLSGFVVTLMRSGFRGGRKRGT